MMDNIRQKFFLVKAFEMGAKYVMENAPVCPKCGERVLRHSAGLEEETDLTVIHTESWECSCGNRIEGRRMRGPSHKALTGDEK